METVLKIDQHEDGQMTSSTGVACWWRPPLKQQKSWRDRRQWRTLVHSV